jgi:pimeloyl-ACP methyl ester carboxylesterase
MFSYPLGVGGTTIRVIQSGLTGPKVVFVHGTGARADRWTSNLEAVAESGRAAYAFDLPGHGFSDKSGSFDHSVPGYAALLGQFLDLIGAEHCVLVGTSLGGAVVSHYAVSRPERVDALVLVGSMGLVPLGEEVRKRIGGGAVNQSLEGIRAKFKRVVSDPARVTESLIEEEFRFNNSPGAAESFASLGNYIATRLDDDVVGDKLDALTMPLLLVWGTDDPVVPPAIGEAAHKKIVRSEYATIPGASHTAYWEDPQRFNQLLADFLRRLPD